MGRLKPFPDTPPPGPFRAEFWKSPLRGRRLTAILGLTLLVGMTIVLVTGFLSHAAYNPSLPMNALVDPSRDLPLTFDWFTSPSWIYVLTQGLHVTIGLAVIPIVLAKLWSVMPRLFAWPPVNSPAQALERVSIALLVSSTIFLLVTGLVNAGYWYPFDFNFVVAHYWGAVIFLGSFLVHLGLKLPVALGRREEEPDTLKAARPGPVTISRRGLLAFTGAGAGLVVVGNAGQAIGGPFRKLAFLAPRRESGFPVNKTAAVAGVTPDMTGSSWRLALNEDTLVSREQLAAMPQSTQSLPIACVEGWSATRSWTGVTLAQLAEMAGVPDASEVLVESLQQGAPFAITSLSRDQIHDSRSMLALQVEGEDLSLDHGFPARIIVPALPGVHNTKWVAKMTFTA
ncbi:MAG: molybdopterin-dependent oxidoreductase [Solirubrobacteraceae bacterium]